MSQSRLIVDKVVKSYGDVAVLSGVDLSVAAGEAVAIVGPSGSGKSTLLNIVGALDVPDSGRVSVDGVEIGPLPQRGLSSFRARKVGFVFQHHHLLPQLDAVENVLLAALAAGREDCEAEALTLLARVGLDARARSFPAQLSGGERQRVAVARALLNRPALLLCDEPTGSLDRASGEAVLALILELARETRAAALIVTHNEVHARRCDRWLAMRAGVLTAEP